MLLANVQIYELDNMIAFKKPLESEPFIVVPKCSVKIRLWSTKGFLFEDIETGNDIVNVENPGDIYDKTNVQYGVTRTLVYDALSAFLCSDSSLQSIDQNINTLVSLAELETFMLTPGNNVSITYYSGVALGNPSGNIDNIETIVYTEGVNVIATKTLSYNSNDNIISVVIS